MTVTSAALISALLTQVLARLALAWGWVDAPAGPAAERKLQSRPVPPVGGAAILLTLFVLAGLGLGPLGGQTAAGVPGSPVWSLGIPIGVGTLPNSVVILSLAGVFLVGLADDSLPAGLRPRSKLLGQAAALLPLAWAVVEGGAGSLPALALFGTALVAVNVLNTFDNADGAVALTACVGLGVSPGSVSTGVLGSILGFLPFNLGGPSRRAAPPSPVGSEPRGAAAPRAYLGDSGAYVLGLLLLLHPTAWTALWIPFLDLARLSVVRLAAGGWPWIGDRRHLAHRLQSRGLGPARVAGVLALLALPGCLAPVLFPASSVALGAGFLLGAICFIGTLYRACPCPRRRTSE